MPVPQSRKPSHCIYTNVKVQGVPATLLVDSGATVSCLGACWYAQHRALLLATETSPRVITSADGSVILVSGVTASLEVRWADLEHRHSFMVVQGSLPADGIIGMDLLNVFDAIIYARQKQVEISLAIPAAAVEDWGAPTRIQTIQVAQIPSQSSVIVTVPNPISPRTATLFEPGELPEGILSVASITQGDQVWVQITNLRQDPFMLWAGLPLGQVESATIPVPEQVAAVQQATLPSPVILPDTPPRLEPEQAVQLQHLLHELRDVFSQHEDDIGRTQLVEHAIHTQGPTVHVPARRQNPYVREEVDKQAHQMLRQGHRGHHG